MNYYIDINGTDRSHEIENNFNPTLEEIKNDPMFFGSYFYFMPHFIFCHNLYYFYLIKYTN